MAQDPNLSANNGIVANQRATPRGNRDGSFRLKYDSFVRRVKISAQKAKAEAKRKRTEQRILRGYKHNKRMVEDLQNKRNFSLSTETLQNTSTSSIDGDINAEQKGDDEGRRSSMMDDDWTAIVIHKKPTSKSASILPDVPLSAPAECA